MVALEVPEPAEQPEALRQEGPPAAGTFISQLKPAVTHTPTNTHSLTSRKQEVKVASHPNSPVTQQLIQMFYTPLAAMTTGGCIHCYALLIKSTGCGPRLSQGHMTRENLQNLIHVGGRVDGEDEPSHGRQQQVEAAPPGLVQRQNCRKAGRGRSPPPTVTGSQTPSDPPSDGPGG